MGTVLLGYENPKPLPVPEHTRDHIVTVLPIPVSRLIERRAEAEGITFNAAWARLHCMPHTVHLAALKASY